MTQSKHQTGDWAEVLEQIRAALEATLAVTQTRERQTPSELPEPRTPAALAEAEARIGRLRQIAEEARRQQIEQAAALAEGEERLRCWLDDALAARRRLAEWADRAVG
jgi:hypothetical protein